MGLLEGRRCSAFKVAFVASLSCTKLDLARRRRSLLHPQQQTTHDTNQPTAIMHLPPPTNPPITNAPPSPPTPIHPQESTDGSWIEAKESSLVWHYRDADPDFGNWQVGRWVDEWVGGLECGWGVPGCKRKQGRSLCRTFPLILVECVQGTRMSCDRGTKRQAGFSQSPTPKPSSTTHSTTQLNPNRTTSDPNPTPKPQPHPPHHPPPQPPPHPNPNPNPTPT